tara:strand:+ start:253 stop:903 length:651 start_codon:yes stop_codon:yes gene_type:complete
MEIDLSLIPLIGLFSWNPFKALKKAVNWIDDAVDWIDESFQRSMDYVGREMRGVNAHVVHMKEHGWDKRYTAALDHYANLGKSWKAGVLRSNLRREGVKGDGPKVVTDWMKYYADAPKHTRHTEHFYGDKKRNEEIIKWTKAFEKVYDSTMTQFDTMKMIKEQEERLGKPEPKATKQKERREDLIIGSKPTITATGRYSQNPSARQGLKISGGLGY